MKITDDHRERAARLTMHPLDPMPVPPDRLGHYRRLTLAAPAGYLAAVERIPHDDVEQRLWAHGQNPTQLRESAYELLVLADEAEARR